MQTIVLTEYTPLRLPAETLPLDAGTMLWQRFGKQIGVEFPSPKTNQQWQLTPQGWVGALPLGRTITVLLQPRIPFANLFGMLEYAYHLQSLRFLEGIITCDSLPEFYERLAYILARRILVRGRQGLLRDYVQHSGKVAAVRGQLDVPHMAQHPWEAYPTCTYSEHTADNEDNQILAWTLYIILQSGLCTERSLPAIRKAFRMLQQTVTLQPIEPAACSHRTYHRLNIDYQPLHALCRFFLEHAGPGYAAGEHQMIPFMVDMARLFEQFVASWLRAHLPQQYTLAAQEPVRLTVEGHLRFVLDLVLRDSATSMPRCILDTKYKPDSTPESDDIAQVVAYAAARDCHDAVLIYPSLPDHPIDISVGTIRVRSAAFALSDTIEEAGQALLRQIL
jgi:5-methylcytosine-specific restriction enzyme subunit McrC